MFDLDDAMVVGSEGRWCVCIAYEDAFSTKKSCSGVYGSGSDRAGAKRV